MIDNTKPSWAGRAPTPLRKDRACCRPACKQRRRSGGKYCLAHHAEHMRRLRALWKKVQQTKLRRTP